MSLNSHFRQLAIPSAMLIAKSHDIPAKGLT